MTEIPEHLLKRSRERREALGLSTGDDGGGDAAGGRTAAAATPATEVAPACGRHAGARARAAAAPAAVAPPPKPDRALRRRPRKRRKQIPFWAMPGRSRSCRSGRSSTPAVARRRRRRRRPARSPTGQALFAELRVAATAADGAGGWRRRRLPAQRRRRCCRPSPTSTTSSRSCTVGLEPATSASPTATRTGRGGQPTSARRGMPAWGEIGSTDRQQIVDVVCYERVGAAPASRPECPTTRRDHRRHEPPAAPRPTGGAPTSGCAATGAATTSSSSAAARPGAATAYWLARQATTSSSSSEDVPAREDVRRRPHAAGRAPARRHGPGRRARPSSTASTGCAPSPTASRSSCEWPEHPVFPSLRLRRAPPRPRPDGRRARGEGRRRRCGRAPRRSRRCSTAGSCAARSSTDKATGATEEVRARYVVVADGANSRFGRALGTARDRAYPQGMAIRGYYESPLHDEPWIESRARRQRPQRQLAARLRLDLPGRRRHGQRRRRPAVDVPRLQERQHVAPAATSSPRPRPTYWEIDAGRAVRRADRRPAADGRLGRPQGRPDLPRRRRRRRLVNPFNGEGIDYAYETGRMAADVLARGAVDRRRRSRCSATRSCSTTSTASTSRWPGCSPRSSADPALMRELTRVGMHSPHAHGVGAADHGQPAAPRRARPGRGRLQGRGCASSASSPIARRSVRTSCCRSARDGTRPRDPTCPCVEVHGIRMLEQRVDDAPLLVEAVLAAEAAGVAGHGVLESRW